MRKLALTMVVIALMAGACGDSGEGPSPSAESPAPTTQGEGNEDGGSSAVFAMPSELADHPLPDDADIPFEPSDFPADQDPRHTLQVTVVSSQPFDAVAQVIDAGLPANGYTVEASQISTNAQTFWEWSKDGLPGVTTAASNADGGVTLNINLFRSGTR